MNHWWVASPCVKTGTELFSGASWRPLPGHRHSQLASMGLWMAHRSLWKPLLLCFQKPVASWGFCGSFRGLWRPISGSTVWKKPLETPVISAPPGVSQPPTADEVDHGAKTAELVPSPTATKEKFLGHSPALFLCGSVRLGLPLYPILYKHPGLGKAKWGRRQVMVCCQ